MKFMLSSLSPVGEKPVECWCGGAAHRPPRTNAAALGKFYMTVMQGMTIQARDGATQKELLAVARAAMLQWPEFS
jgi:hypothetical protein